MAHILAQGLTSRLGQQVVVENRPGATGTIGSAHVARSRPDEHTLVMGGVNTHAMNDSLFRRPQYDSARDFAPICLTARIPIAFVAHLTAAPVASFAQIIELARARPKELSYGSSGAGWPQLTDLLAGRIALSSIDLPPVLPHVESGRPRAFTVTRRTCGPQLTGECSTSTNHRYTMRGRLTNS